MSSSPLSIHFLLNYKIQNVNTSPPSFYKHHSPSVPLRNLNIFGNNHFHSTRASQRLLRSSTLYINIVSTRSNRQNRKLLSRVPPPEPKRPTTSRRSHTFLRTTMDRQPNPIRIMGRHHAPLLQRQPSFMGFPKKHHVVDKHRRRPRGASQHLEPSNSKQSNHQNSTMGKFQLSHKHSRSRSKLHHQHDSSIA